MFLILLGSLCCSDIFKMASEVAGFRTLRVKFDQNCSSNHVLYFKKHTLREEESTRPPDRTLFVVNVPPYCDKGALKRLFGTCGAVQSVYLMKQPGKVQNAKKSSLINTNKDITGFKVAYVVFKSSSSLDKAMKLDSSQVRVMSDDDHHIQTGMEKWCHQYSLRYPNPERLQAEVDKFMANYDQEQEKVKSAEEEARGQPDDEGWVTVGKGGRKPAASKIEAAELREKKKKKKQQAVINFYQFQQRETRREHIAQLRKRFEEDKKKISDMKAARKFRPY